MKRAVLLISNGFISKTNEIDTWPKDKFIASPLFDAHKTFVRLPMGLSMLAEYPDSKAIFREHFHSIPEAQQDFIHTQAFLKSYSLKRSYLSQLSQ